jgi:hypothetical protein
MSSISGITPFIEPPVPPVGLPPENGLAIARNVVTDAQSISSDLQSGDLASAQQAFNSLSQLVGSVAAPGTTPALTALGNALQSGNVSAAKSALAQFGKDLVGNLQKVASHSAGNPGVVKGIDTLIASLDSIPGVTGSPTPVAQSAGSNSGSGAATQSGSNALNVIA